MSTIEEEKQTLSQQQVLIENHPFLCSCVGPHICAYSQLQPERKQQLQQVRQDIQAESNDRIHQITEQEKQKIQDKKYFELPFTQSATVTNRDNQIKSIATKLLASSRIPSESG